MKASPTQQNILLDLANQDTQILRLQRALKELPQKAQLVALDNDAKPLRIAHLEAQKKFEGLKDRVSKIEADLLTLEKRCRRNEKMLMDAAQAKLAQNITAEQETLRLRIKKLEAEILELTADVEGAQQDFESAEDEIVKLKAAREKIIAEGKQEQAKLRTQLAAVESERENLAAAVTGELLQEYETIRQRTGIGAAKLQDGVSYASNMSLSPGELAQITSVPADEIIYCPATGVILVRKDS